MDETAAKIYSKLKSVMAKPNVSEGDALDFFSHLTPDDYSKLIELLEKNELPGIQDETKQKLLTLFEKLGGGEQ